MASNSMPPGKQDRRQPGANVFRQPCDDTQKDQEQAKQRPLHERRGIETVAAAAAAARHLRRDVQDARDPLFSTKVRARDDDGCSRAARNTSVADAPAALCDEQRQHDQKHGIAGNQVIRVEIVPGLGRRRCCAVPRHAFRPGGWLSPSSAPRTNSSCMTGAQGRLRIGKRRLRQSRPTAVVGRDRFPASTDPRDGGNQQKDETPSPAPTSTSGPLLTSRLPVVGVGGVVSPGGRQPCWPETDAPGADGGCVVRLAQPHVVRGRGRSHVRHGRRHSRADRCVPDSAPSPPARPTRGARAHRRSVSSRGCNCSRRPRSRRIDRSAASGMRPGTSASGPSAGTDSSSRGCRARSRYWSRRSEKYASSMS